VSRAISERAGLLFIHSHPNPGHPAGLSPQDRAALTSLGTTIAPLLAGPFAAVAVHHQGWAGAVWDGTGLCPIDRVVSVGRTLRPLSLSVSEPDRAGDALDARQADALGIVHTPAAEPSRGRDRRRRDRVADCRAARPDGVGTVTLADHDALDTPSNVRRVFGSTAADLAATTPPAKVDVVGRHLDQLGLTTTIRRIQRTFQDRNAPGWKQKARGVR